jgi:hypothetical protein
MQGVLVKKFLLLFLLCFAVFPLWSGDIAPPPWIQGQWVMEYEGEVVVVIFLANDIFLNGESLTVMIRDGYITRFFQDVTESSYSVHIEYADGFWWQETFPIPVMVSTYTDKSYDGNVENLVYTFMPWTGGGQSEVPDDFK